MRKKTTFILLFLCACSMAMAQKAVLKGNISDTTDQKALPNAVIAVLRQSDSVLQTFTRSGADGHFQLTNLPAGHYLLLVTYPRFADFVAPLSLPADTLWSLGNISLIRKSDLLKEVIVTHKTGAIRMNGDTLEFKADSFKVQEGANVEELLKKLPGIQVNSKGEITAQGQKVQKVLVDGEEFFGDDPTLVTQNLRADMVDKVQMFDKTSDQAAFTGIDDGERAKTLNLKLKENKKNGYFGQATASGGTDKYYDEQAMFNYFKKKLKLAVYGIVSNTGKTGLNWQERDKYGQSFAGMLDYDETSGGFVWNGADNNMNDIESWDGRYNGDGIPSVKTGGAHYNNKWQEDKQNLNVNYKAMQLSVEGGSNTVSEYILPGTPGATTGKSQYGNQTQSFTNQIMRHRADANYEIKFDSASSLKLIAYGGADHKITANGFDGETRGSDSALVNLSQRHTSTTADIANFNSMLIWRRKLAKKGRTLSVNVDQKYEHHTSAGYIFSHNDFYRQDTVYLQQQTDQFKRFESEKRSVNGKIMYTEPISKSSFLAVNYTLDLGSSRSNRTSYNKSAAGKYTELDPLYSNDYEVNALTNYGGLGYSLIKKKLKINSGVNWGLTRFEQRDMQADTSVVRRFTNWYPHATVSYFFTQQKRFNFNYNGNTEQPSIEQIQPLRNNEDPLNIYIGNPALKPSFSNNIWVHYNDYKVLNDRFISFNGSFSNTINAISSKETLDRSTGKATSQSVNLNGNYSFSLNMDYSFKLQKAGMNLGFNGQYRHSRYANIVNDVLNATNSNNYTFGLGLYKSKEKKYDLNAEASATYTNSVSSIQTGNTTRYWTYYIGPSATVYLPWKFNLHADARIDLRPKTPQFPFSNNTSIVNASIGKKMLKKDQLQLKLSANDLLNQNIGLNRYVNSNNITQTTQQTLRRYYMVSLIWNFTKAGSPAPQH